MSNTNMHLDVPELGLVIYDGNHVRLGRFSKTSWEVRYGWYSWGGNRSLCGWYLVNDDDEKMIKSLQKTDLDDVYLVENR